MGTINSLVTYILQNIRKKFTQVWDNLRVSKWLHNYIFWGVNYPFKSECVHTSAYVCIRKVHSVLLGEMWKEKRLIITKYIT